MDSHRESEKDFDRKIQNKKEKTNKIIH